VPHLPLRQLHCVVLANIQQPQLHMCDCNEVQELPYCHAALLKTTHKLEHAVCCYHNTSVMVKQYCFVMCRAFKNVILPAHSYQPVDCLPASCSR